jgi:UDP-N-acetylmuramate dehydrogenase
MDLRAVDFSSLKGAIHFDAPLAPLSWFRVGGPADLLFTPENEDDLVSFLKLLPRSVPLYVIGLGSNLLVRDGGIRGAVIRLGKAFQTITIEADHHIRAGAQAADVKVARMAAEAGIAGFSFLRGIPGTIGGALGMNGGAYGGEIKDIFVSACGIDREGRVQKFDHASMGFSYRHTSVASDIIFTEALFKGQAGDPTKILDEMNAITDARSSTQPVNTRTGGSTFRNPEGKKAWELIDQAGLRGYRIGGAEISKLHTNFLIAHDGATAADLESLGEEARRRVKEMTGITLEWEIKIVGEPVR